MRSALFLLLALAAHAPAWAQPETVPAEHGVYAFLHQQRTAGRLPEYRHEMRPLARGEVQRLLDSLSVRSTSTRGGAAYWLDDYRREFFEPETAIEAVLGDGPAVRLPMGRDTEKFLFYRRSDSWRVAVEARGAGQARWGRGRVLPEDSTTTAEPVRNVAFTPELTIQGHYRDRLGFYTRTFNGQSLAGDTRALQDDPDLAPLYYIGRAGDAAGVVRPDLGVGAAPGRTVCRRDRARAPAGRRRPRRVPWCWPAAPTTSPTSGFRWTRAT